MIKVSFSFMENFSNHSVKSYNYYEINLHINYTSIGYFLNGVGKGGEAVLGHFCEIFEF